MVEQQRNGNEGGNSMEPTTEEGTWGSIGIDFVKGHCVVVVFGFLFVAVVVVVLGGSAVFEVRTLAYKLPSRS